MDDEGRQRLDHVSDEIINSETIRMVTNTDENVLDLGELWMSRSAGSLDIDYNLLTDMSFREVVVHLISLSVGSVFISIPLSAKEIFGDNVGFVVVLTTLFLYLYSLNTFLWSKYEVCQSERLPHLSYPSFIQFALKDGPLDLRSFTELGARITITVFVLFLVCGCCYSFLLGAKNIQLVYNLWAAEPVDLRLVLIWIIVPLLVLCWLVRYEHLALVSIVAHLLSMLSIAAVFYNSAYSIEPLGSLATLTQMPFYLFGFFFMLCALGSDTRASVSEFRTFLTATDSCDKEERRNFKKLFAGISVLFMYAIFGFRCSLKYGTRVVDTWQNAPQSNPSYQCAVLANAFALLFQYPLLVHLMFTLVQNSLMKECEETGSSFFGWDYLPRMAMTMTVFLSIYHLQSVDIFLILGNIFGTIIDSLLFPAFILMLVAWKVGRNKELGGRLFDKNMIIGFLALMLVVLGTMSCAFDVLRYCKYDTEFLKYH